MELLKLLFICTLHLSVALVASVASFDNYYDQVVSLHEPEEVDYPSERISRYLANKSLAANTTCDVSSKVCRRLKGSLKRDCCNKKCVDLRSDRVNCGVCGLSCSYNRTCCKRRCVNISNDRKNCGGCKKRCKKGKLCAYGMCNY